MTTPDTAAVRAWARKQGIPVADRGRLPAELRDAYLARSGGTKAAALSVPTTAKITKAAAPTKAATSAKAASKAFVRTTRQPAALTAVAPKAATMTEAPDTAEARLATLEKQLAALTTRLVTLETAAAGKSGRFRRRSS